MVQLKGAVARKGYCAKVNRYGQLAREHWRSSLPMRYSSIAEPDEFFTALGQTIQHQIADTAQQLLAIARPAADDSQRLDRLREVQQRAEKCVIAELLYLPPEI